MGEIHYINLIHDSKEKNDKLLQQLTVVNHEDDCKVCCIDNSSCNVDQSDIVTTLLDKDEASLTENGDNQMPKYCWISIKRQSKCNVNISKIEIISSSRRIEVYGEKLEYLHTSSFSECLQDTKPVLYYVGVDNLNNGSVCTQVTLKLVSLASQVGTLAIEAILVHVSHCEPQVVGGRSMINVDNVMGRVEEATNMTPDRRQMAADLLSQMQSYQKSADMMRLLPQDGVGGQGDGYMDLISRAISQLPQAREQTDQPAAKPDARIDPTLESGVGQVDGNVVHLLQTVRADMRALEQRLMRRVDAMEDHIMRKLDALQLHLMAATKSAPPATVSVTPTTVSVTPTTVSATPTTVSATPTTVSVTPTTVSATDATVSSSLSTTAAAVHLLPSP